MKKITAAVLACAVFSAALFGCGSSADKASSEAASEAASSAAESVAEESEAAESEAAESEAAVSEAAESEAAESEAAESEAAVSEAAESEAAESEAAESEAAVSEAAESEAAEGESDWAYIQEKGKMVIGITEFDPANYYDENGELVGFDTELTEATCKELGIEPEFVIIDWDSKDLELKSKNIDCIWNMFGVNEERKSYTDFTYSYIMNGEVPVIRKADEKTYTDLESLNQGGLTVVFEEGSTGQGCAEENFPDTDLTPVAGQTDAMLEVKAGTADFCVVDFLTASKMTASPDYSDLMIVPDVVLSVEYDSAGFRKGSDAVEKVNEVLKKLYEDGTAAAIAEKYDLTDQAVLTEDI